MMPNSLSKVPLCTVEMILTFFNDDFFSHLIHCVTCHFIVIIWDISNFWVKIASKPIFFFSSVNLSFLNLRIPRTQFDLDISQCLQGVKFALWDCHTSTWMSLSVSFCFHPLSLSLSLLHLHSSMSLLKYLLTRILTSAFDFLPVL